MSVTESISRSAARMAEAALDLVFPKRCYVCGRDGRYLCDACRQELPSLHRPFCLLCAQPLQRALPYCRRCQEQPLHIDGIRSPYLMEGPVRNMVHALKYNGVRSLAQPVGDLLAQFALQEQLKADVVVPVPLHHRKERERGYNQSLLLARACSASMGVPVADDALRRLRYTPPQARSADSEERRANVSNAFAAETTLVRGKRVLVLDDVCTTGATLEACAIALRDAGGTSVWGLTLAREA